MKKSLKTNLLSLTLSLLLAASLLGGCTQSSTDNASKTNSSSTGFPVTVTNYDGTELTISQKPERIASLTLGMDEMLLEMADESRIVGLSGKMLTMRLCPTLRTKPLNSQKSKTTSKLF